MAQPTEAGVAQCVLEFATAQRARGIDVQVACPTDGWLAARLTAAGVPVHPWAAGRSPGPASARETRALGRIVRAVAPDLVHLHASKAGLAGRLAVHGRHPTVFQPHAWSFEAVTGPVRRATLVWERLAVRWTDALICVSEAERADGVAAGVVVPRTFVVPNGVDLAAPAATVQDRAAARGRLGLDPDARWCVCVGRLARQKGQDLLLAAWPAVTRDVAGARLALVGDGPDRAALAQAAPPGVVLAGARTDVPDWYAAADVVVAPSRWEGMALVPLEAMARGRSVVVSDAAGMAESVPDGAGAVVRLDPLDQLAEALVARLGGAIDADAEGAVGRGYVEQHHDLGRTVERLNDAYAQVLGGSSRAGR